MNHAVFRRPRLVAATLALCTALLAPVAQAQITLTGFHQAVAETAARDDALAAFYRGRGFEGLWAGSDAAAQNRRNALLSALSEVAAHGIPASRYDVQGLMDRLHGATGPADQGRMDVELSRLLLLYAHDVNTGILNPRQVIATIKREVPVLDGAQILADFIAAPSPSGYLRQLAPQAPEYARLQRNYLSMQAQQATGGWGLPVSGDALGPGDSGERVVGLRNRLVAMGYLGRSVTQTYDSAIRNAVERFQAAHGMTVDGVAGPATIAAINVPMPERMQSVLVAMERERWMNIDRGDRHIWVNLTDFHAEIVDFDRVTFSTRSIIGATGDARETPEFSDVMDHMVINPTWFIPRSIIVGQYLPSLRSNSGALSHLQVIDSRGRVVSRNTNFSRYSASSFPYSMRQPPGPSNALGQVKFMFPNRYNIYLHDTPTQNLFVNPVRAYSHGCIRLDDPYEFAYHLLAAQEDDPVAYFDGILRTGAERRVNLQVPIPVHLVYRTAFTSVTGELQFRDDIYGRDARIWDALAREGLVIAQVQG